MKRTIVLLGELLHEAPHEHRNVALALAKRREIHAQNIQSIEQVGPELSALHSIAQGSIGRRHYAHVHRNSDGSADPRHLALLQHPQKLYLNRVRNLADLIEKNRTAVREFESPQSSLGGAGERALLVAEQFALQQRLGQRPHVHGDKCLVATWTELVNGARHEFLAGPALALEQDGAADGGDVRHLHQHFAHRLRFTKQSGNAGQSLTFENAPYTGGDLLIHHRLAVDLDVPNAPQPTIDDGVAHVGESHHGHVVP